MEPNNEKASEIGDHIAKTSEDNGSQDVYGYYLAYEDAKEVQEDLKEEIKDLKKFNRFLRLVVLILLIIIILLLLRGCGCDCKCAPNTSGVLNADTVTVEAIKEPDMTDPVIPEPDPTQSNDQTGKDYLVLPVIMDMVVTKDLQEVVFYNPVENKDLFDIRFIITQGEDVKYDSDWREPDTKWNVNLYKIFGPGSHNVRVSMSARYVDSHEPVNGAGSNVTITVLQK